MSAAMLGAVVVGTALLLASTSAYAAGPSVTTLSGVIHGSYTFEGVARYAGIPFAKPPTGQLRFRPPVAWDGSYGPDGLSAVEFGARCVSKAQNGSEDCLFLNVFVPPSKNGSQDADGYPVMFYIHGGGFVEGDSSQYEGTWLALKHGAIIVTINYRLGMFGFAAPKVAYANFGFKDQRLAMQWAKANIASFGGNAQQMMIFGGSAGAISVHGHLVARKSFGLFKAAIAQSGCMPTKIQEKALNLTLTVAKTVGCQSGPGEELLTCLQLQSVDALNAADPTGANPFYQTAWGPSRDEGGNETEFPDDPRRLEYNGAIAPNVNVIAGSNTDEGHTFVYPFFPKGLNRSAYLQLVPDFLFNNQPFDAAFLDAILDKYPASDGDNRDTAAQLIADGTFICGARYLAKAFSRPGISSAYLYRFARKDWQGRAVHTAEVKYVFDNNDGIFMPPEARRMADRIGLFWETFAAFGAPGKGSEFGSNWTAFSPASGINIVLDNLSTDNAAFETQQDYRKDICDFWLTEPIP